MYVLFNTDIVIFNLKCSPIRLYSQDGLMENNCFEDQILVGLNVVRGIEFRTFRVEIQTSLKQSPNNVQIIPTSPRLFPYNILDLFTFIFFFLWILVLLSLRLYVYMQLKHLDVNCNWLNNVYKTKVTLYNKFTTPKTLNLW